MGHDDMEAVIESLRGLGERPVRERNLALLTQPPLFDIEVASACNIVCAFCPRDEMVRVSKLMDESTFAAVLALLPANAVAMISGLGDATVHPRLPEMVGRLVAKGVSTCMITNGVRLTDGRQVALIEAGISEIQVSVHGWSDEVVRRVVPVGSAPGTVRANVERLAARVGPRVRVNFVETDDNGHERETVRAWAESLGVRFFHRRQHTRGGTIGHDRGEGCSGCGIFGSVTFISVDGDVLPCVNDVRGDGRFGNVRQVDWESVLVWKRGVIDAQRWFGACRSCDDDYRWVILANGGLNGA